MSSPLPPPRRVITWHDPATGECRADDATVPIEPMLGGVLDAAKIMVQSDFPAKPEKTPEYMEKSDIPSFFHPNGVTAFYIDFRPGYSGVFHYSDTFDYAVVVSGEVVTETEKGQGWPLKAGDSVVNAANVRKWHNRTNEWSRVFFVFVPSEPFKFKGKNLKELYPDILAVV